MFREFGFAFCVSEVFPMFFESCVENIKEQEDEIHKEGTIPKMKGLPKTHKEEIGMRPVVNGRGSVIEKLEKELVKVFKVVEIR